MRLALGSDVPDETSYIFMGPMLEYMMLRLCHPHDSLIFL